MDTRRSQGSHRTLGLVGLLVLAAVMFVAVALAQREAPQGPAFVAAEVSDDLRAATVDLIGYPPDGSDSLDDVFAVADRSVGEMSTLDADTFRGTWERSALQQATVVGHWLGLATRELRGPGLNRVYAARTRLTARAPMGLRVTLQDAYADALGR